MDQFLAETLLHMNQLSKSNFDDLTARFRNSMENNCCVFGDHAFRKHTSQSQSRNVINIALFDVFSVLLADSDPMWTAAHKEQIQALFYELMEHEEFFRAISEATNSLSNGRARFAIARQAFEELEHAH
jgi:hypothetical protein